MAIARSTLELQGTLSQRDLVTAMHELAAARAARETAESEWTLAAERRRALEALLAEHAGAERERADEGVARACDLVQAQCFEVAAAERMKAERGHEQKALTQLQEAQATERAAEGSLARVRLGERAIEDRLASVAAVERKEREDARDEASQDEAVARRRGPT